MKYNGAEITIKLLEKYGIKIITGIPGGANLPLYDALFKNKIKHVLARHEQGAGFIAHGIARSTGKPAVCLVTSGPGTTNLITAIADAKLDSIPIIAITGQVASDLIGTNAFQEINTYNITFAITKKNYLVKSAKKLLKIIPEAFKTAVVGRPGPVVIDIPKNVQLEEIKIDRWPEIVNLKQTIITNNNNSTIRIIANEINKSKRPLLYIGGGIINSEASNEIYEFAKKNSIPVISTLMSLGAFPSDDSLFYGMPGMHGAKYTNYIIDEADLIIALGVRFDDRVTGRVETFCNKAKIIHIDIDKNEINKIKKIDYSICTDVKSLITNILPRIEKNNREEWISYLSDMKRKYPLYEDTESLFLHPVNIIKTISQIVPSDTIITTDVGQHQMWTAQVYPFMHPRTFLTSGGLGTMGFGVPAAIGAGLANPKKIIVCISGDGSMLMNIQELALLKELGLNVKIIIMNNKHLGLVRQQQELFYNKNYIASRFDCDSNFTEIGKSFGIDSIRINDNIDLSSIIKEAISRDGPFIIEILIDENLNVFPMVAPGASNTEMITTHISEKN